MTTAGASVAPIASVGIPALSVVAAAVRLTAVVAASPLVPVPVAGVSPVGVARVAGRRPRAVALPLLLDNTTYQITTITEPSISTEPSGYTHLTGGRV